MASSPDMDMFWAMRIKEDDRKEAGKSICDFMRQYGRMYSNPHLADDNPFRVYYAFPSFNSDILKGANLGRLYQFFFMPREVKIETTMKFE